MVAIEQQTLIPTSPLTMYRGDVVLHELPPNSDPLFAGRHLTKQSPFVQNIAELGMLNPITLLSIEGKYRIEAGRNRILAARLLGWEKIPATIIVLANDLAPGVVALAENMQRSENLIGEIRAVRALLDQQHTEQEIAASLHVRSHRVRWLAKLSYLPEGLLDAMATGRLKPTVAERIASLPMQHQEELAQTEGRITMSVVKEIMTARRTAVLEALPPFPDLPEPKVDPDVLSDLLATVVQIDVIAREDEFPDFDAVAIDVLALATRLMDRIEGNDEARHYWEEGNDLLQRAAGQSPGTQCAFLRRALFVFIAVDAMLSKPASHGTDTI